MWHFETELEEKQRTSRCRISFNNFFLLLLVVVVVLHHQLVLKVTKQQHYIIKVFLTICIKIYIYFCFLKIYCCIIIQLRISSFSAVFCCFLMRPTRAFINGKIMLSQAAYFLKDKYIFLLWINDEILLNDKIELMYYIRAHKI